MRYPGEYAARQAIILKRRGYVLAEESGY